MTRKRTKEAREAIVASVIGFVNTEYGTNINRLSAWQKLCGDVGVPVGTSIKQCQRNLQGTYVNIVDYTEAKAKGQDFRRFVSRQELSNYIRKRPHKCFPRDEAKKSPILRWMLIKLC